MSGRSVTNLLGLACLACLAERPMHRYEMAATIRERGKDRQLAVKPGSLYTVVDTLTRRGFAEPTGTDREGGRPERVTYAITAEGLRELREWARDLLTEPQQHADPFVAGLSVLAVLSPGEAVVALESQANHLTEQLSRCRDDLAEARRQGVPRLFLVEDEYLATQLTTRLDWIGGLLDELRSGTFPDLAAWRERSERAADRTDGQSGDDVT